MLCTVARARGGEIYVYVTESLMFGPRGAPHVFCCVTDKVSAVLSVLILVPNVAHVDDFCGVEEQSAIDSARSAVAELHAALNLRLKASKSAPPRDVRGGAEVLCAFGGDVDFSTTPT